MTLEDLEVRLQIIENNMKQTVANYNLQEGNKQECLFWIDRLKKKKDESESNVTLD
jgi:hypothetical protein